jgi:hypothetical protein
LERPPHVGEQVKVQTIEEINAEIWKYLPHYLSEFNESWN